MKTVKETEQPTHALQRLDTTKSGGGNKWPNVAFLQIPPGTDPKAVAAFVVERGLATAREIQRNKVRLFPYAQIQTHRKAKEAFQLPA